MQVEHKTEKGTIRFDLLPDDSFDIRIRFKRMITYRTYDSSQIKLYDPGFVPVGLTSEVTEEQVNMMVDEYEYSTNVTFRKKYPHNAWTNISALESFKSLIQHLQVYDANPYDKPNINEFKTFPFCPTGECKAYFDLLNEWQEAEQKSGKWVVLFKEN